MWWYCICCLSMSIIVKKHHLSVRFILLALMSASWARPRALRPIRGVARSMTHRHEVGYLGAKVEGHLIIRQNLLEWVPILRKKMGKKVEGQCIDGWFSWQNGSSVPNRSLWETEMEWWGEQVASTRIPQSILTETIR